MYKEKLCEKIVKDIQKALLNHVLKESLVRWTSCLSNCLSVYAI